MRKEIKPVATHNANVFLPGCLGPVNREVVLIDDHNAYVEALRVELCGNPNEAVAEIQLSDDGYKIGLLGPLRAHRLPIGTKLYTRQTDNKNDQEIKEGFEIVGYLLTKAKQLSRMPASKDDLPLIKLEQCIQIEDRLLKLLARCQERLDPHRDAVLWNDVRDELLKR